MSRLSKASTGNKGSDSPPPQQPIVGDASSTPASQCLLDGMFTGSMSGFLPTPGDQVGKMPQNIHSLGWCIATHASCLTQCGHQNIKLYASQIIRESKEYIFRGLQPPLIFIQELGADRSLLTLS